MYKVNYDYTHKPENSYMAAGWCIMVYFYSIASLYNVQRLYFKFCKAAVNRILCPNCIWINWTCKFAQRTFNFNSVFSGTWWSYYIIKFVHFYLVCSLGNLSFIGRIFNSLYIVASKYHSFSHVLLCRKTCSFSINPETQTSGHKRTPHQIFHF